MCIRDRVIKESDIIYTFVATPSLKDGSYDVSAVQKVVDDILDTPLVLLIERLLLLDALLTQVTVISLQNNCLV